MAIYQSWDVSMDVAGRLVFSVTNDAGRSFRLVSDKAITDTAWHSIGIVYDSDAGKAAITIDGVPSGSMAVEGTTPAMNSWGLVVGNMWGTAFNGNLREIDIFSTGAAGGSAVPDPSPSLPVTAPPETPAAPEVPPETPETPAAGAGGVPADLATIAAAIGRGDHAGLAASLGHDAQ